ncbi:Redoxin-domain-containing protein [Testicularia cyperi]|uniref:Putative peroxiredoxin n=1 Tax=Testicularia cyperi TaxID=1882483 RepID=A0A317XQC1_9BASI|nr:Redoxin-domain-containing protein [Testicularia cyperi]
MSTAPRALRGSVATALRTPPALTSTRLISTTTASLFSAHPSSLSSSIGSRRNRNCNENPLALASSVSQLGLDSAQIRTFASSPSRHNKAINKGDEIPNSTFMYVPYTPELDDGTACGVPTKVQTHEALKGKKVVIVSVPGAYTPTCHVNHIPPYIQQVEEFKAKGVDEVYVIAQNDPFVMSAWGVQNKAQGKVIFATDLGLEFSKAIGSIADLSAMGFGERTGRYALIVDNLKVVDFSPEPSPGQVEVSGAQHVLAKL